MLDGITNKANLDAGTLEFINGVPNIISMYKAIYDEMLKQGFNINQAYDFMKSYMITALTNSK